ncbi:hypothetical protein [Spongiivirga sp. MCCC 1A20706]|uniref:hypothetical protein n=1 Tax=Spongiivirga sp. MCCC 1A20706 TaxID=3160963 RepID=UPI003977B2D6
MYYLEVLLSNMLALFLLAAFSFVFYAAMLIFTKEFRKAYKRYSKNFAVNSINGLSIFGRNLITRLNPTI